MSTRRDKRVPGQSAPNGPIRPYASSPCLLHELDPAFGSEGVGPAQEETVPREVGPDSPAWQDIRRWRGAQRNRLAARRRTLDAGSRKAMDGRIAGYLEERPGCDPGCVAFFWPLPGEPDVRPLAHLRLDRGCQSALTVIGRKSESLEFWRWHPRTALRKGEVWNIPVPAARQVVTPTVILVPLLGFDAEGHRLGHGGGYYDRTLARLDPKPLCVGIGYDIGRLDTIYPQAHDIPMDVIVTESGARDIRPLACDS